MADDNKSCHCEFVPQDLTPGLKVTIRAIWYELFVYFHSENHFVLSVYHSSLYSLFICWLLCTELILLFIHVTFCLFFDLFVLTPGSKVTISCWVRPVSLTSSQLHCFLLFHCFPLSATKAPLSCCLVRHSFVIIVIIILVGGGVRPTEQCSLVLFQLLSCRLFEVKVSVSGLQQYFSFLPPADLQHFSCPVWSS